MRDRKKFLLNVYTRQNVTRDNALKHLADKCTAVLSAVLPLWYSHSRAFLVSWAWPVEKTFRWTFFSTAIPGSHITIFQRFKGKNKYAIKIGCKTWVTVRSESVNCSALKNTVILYCIYKAANILVLKDFQPITREWNHPFREST